MPTEPKLIALPEFETFSVNDTHGAFVIVIEPPPVPYERLPVDIVLCLDVSRSMHGRKLAAAVDSAAAVVKGLTPRDTFACITFSRAAEELVPPSKMTDDAKRFALNRLHDIAVSAGTNLEQGMRRSLEVANRMGRRIRALLMTDGQPSVGVCDPPELVLLAQNALGDATLSTFGYGPDADTSLLGSVADTCRGHFTYVRPNETPMHAIGAELGGVLRTVVAAPKLEIRPVRGASLKLVHRNTGVMRDRSEGVLVQLPALVAGEPQTVGFEMAWSVELPDVLAEIALSGYDPRDGRLVNVAGVVEGCMAQRRGPMVQRAEKHLILARCAQAVELATSSGATAATAVAGALAEQRNSLEAAARLARLESDDHVRGALEMMLEAERVLAAADAVGRHAAYRHVQAVGRALRTMRGTMMPLHPAGASGAFVTKSQSDGMALIKRWSLLPEPAVQPRVKTSLLMTAPPEDERDVPPGELN
jgi:uncharacterized protein YegL